ncbi:MAG: ParB/RepB/Spo0J family partition protein [Bacilli bacterium]|nr:ParB/RepB/Spo0J family partition protein [Bacilli bacterium]
METKRKALGKGLEQLFTNERINFDNFEKDIVRNTSKNDIKEINLDEIRSNPYQPRKTFNEESLNELAASIKEHGVVEPIIVKESIKGYELVAGERRTKASRLAGLKTIPAIIRNFNDEQMMEIALIENIQREDLNPIDEAKGYEAIIIKLGLTQEEVSKKFGKSRSYITNLLGLLRLPENVKKYVQDKSISMGHARVLSKIEDKEKITELAEKIINEKLSVREIEDLVSGNSVKKNNPITRVKPSVNPRYQIYENTMRELVGTKVKISNKKVEIPFDSEKDLERILEILNVKIDD